MLGKIIAATVGVAIFGWLGADAVQARGGGGGGHGGGHGGGGHGGGHFGGGGFHGGYGYGSYGRGYGYGYGGYGRGFGYGGFYPFGLGLGLGYGLGYGGYGYGGYGYGGGGYGGGYGMGGYGYGGYPYGGYGYGGYGYGADPYGGAYGGYASPYGAGYNYPPPVQNGYAPAYPQMPLDPNATYPYNGDPSDVPPLPAPTPRKAPDAPPQGTLPMNGQLLSQSTEDVIYRFAAYGESPETQQVALRANQSASVRETIRVAYPAYGETPPPLVITTQLRK
jgi:hypothetical protein